jgi:hypothetical protein
MHISKIIKIVFTSAIIVITSISFAFSHDNSWRHGGGHHGGGGHGGHGGHGGGHHGWKHAWKQQRYYNQHNHNCAQHNSYYPSNYYQNNNYYHDYGYNQPIIVPTPRTYYRNQGHLGFFFQSGF